MNRNEIFNKIVYTFMGFIEHLISIAAFLVSIVHRLIVHLMLLQMYKKKYRLIDTGMATIMAGETKGPVNVLYVMKCKGAPKFDAIVEKLYQIVEYETKLVSGGESETSYRPFEKLGHVISLKFGVFCWNLDHNFQAANHVVLDRVHEDLDKEIHKRCERLQNTFYEDHQPQWDIHFLHREESGEYAIVWSVHHTFADATIFTQLIRLTLADNPFPIKVDPLEWNRKEQSSFSEIVKYLKNLFLCTLGSGFFAVIYGQCLGQARVKENDLNEERGKRHCRSVTLDFTHFKTIQRKLSNPPIRLISLLFACVAPAIDRAISSSKLEKPTTILASTLEANYPYDSLTLDINVTAFSFDLPLKIKSLQERLKVIDERIKDITGYIGMGVFKIVVVIIGSLIYPIARMLEKSGSLTQTTFVSNIVGPQETFTIFGGDPVTSIYVYSPISIEEAVTCAVYTYCNEITFALISPDRVIRKLPNLLDDILVGIKDELCEYKYIEFSKAVC